MEVYKYRNIYGICVYVCVHEYRSMYLYNVHTCDTMYTYNTTVYILYKCNILCVSVHACIDIQIIVYSIIYTHVSMHVYVCIFIY